jgi:hypothetical protein
VRALGALCGSAFQLNVAKLPAPEMTQFVTIASAAMKNTLRNSRAPWAKKYAGNLRLIVSGGEDAFGPDNRPWFEDNGAWLKTEFFPAFKHHVAENGLDLPCMCPIPCARAPKAEQFVDAKTKEMQVVLVAEGRFENQPLNRAMNKDAKEEDIKKELENLNLAVSKVVLLPFMLVVLTSISNSTTTALVPPRSRPFPKPSAPEKQLRA